MLHVTCFDQLPPPLLQILYHQVFASELHVPRKVVQALLIMQLAVLKARIDPHGRNV